MLLSPQKIIRLIIETVRFTNILGYVKDINWYKI